MKGVRQHRKDIGGCGGLFHETNLFEEDVPIETCVMSSGDGVQLIEPQQRSLSTFMLDMKAEMEDEVFHPETVDVDIHPSPPLTSHPDWSHGFDLEMWWIGQRPVWFHKKTMNRMNEFERIGKVLVKTRTLLMLLIAEPLEDALDGREILTMNEEVQVIHLPYGTVTVQLFREHRATKRDARNTLLVTGHEDRSEFRRQEEIPC